MFKEEKMMLKKLDYSKLVNGWSIITLNFTLKNPEALIEFKGLRASLTPTIHQGMIL